MAQTSVNDVKCPKCGAVLIIHAPGMVEIHNGYITQITLVPSWDIDERKCPGCGCMVAPRIKSVQVETVAYEVAEKPRVEVADLNILRKLRPVG